MSSTAPIVVHRIQGEGGRRVTIRGQSQGHGLWADRWISPVADTSR
ncbi:hypothetical protein ACFXOD_36665 [Streptomyces sp. NPDC059161]